MRVYLFIFSKTYNSSKLLLYYETNDFQKQQQQSNDIGAQFAHTKDSPELLLDFCITPNH